MIKGTLIRLREPRQDDVDNVAEWVQNDEFQFFLAGDPLVPRQKLKELLLAQLNNPSRYEASVTFIIETKKKQESIGLVRFNSISWKSRNAMMEIYIVEEKQNLPYGPDALLTAAHFAFNELNLYKIGAVIFEYNKRSIHVTERGGAKREMILRKHIFRKGQYHDVYGYGMFKSDYDKIIENLKGTFFER